MLRSGTFNYHYENINPSILRLGRHWFRGFRMGHADPRGALVSESRQQLPLPLVRSHPLGAISLSLVYGIHLSCHFS